MRFITIVFLLLPVGSFAQDHHKLSSKVLDQRLPLALSDMTATLDEMTGIVYIAGGCDSATGNEYSQELKVFTCNSISDSFLSYSIREGKVEILAPLPRQRYRHGAEIMYGQLWLIGGRDVEDRLIGEIDVYDFTNKTWSTVETLSEMYQMSDHATFRHKSYIFMVGGYDDFYTALDTTYRIDTTNNEITKMASLQAPRGDVSAVSNGDYAYIVGGYTHINYFCSALDSVERYDFSSDTWETIGPLYTARADAALVVMNGNVVAIGGERLVDNICDLDMYEIPPVGEQTLMVDNAEVLSNWTVWPSALPLDRFRFAAVVWEQTVHTFGGQTAHEQTVYIFGGQTAYNTDCRCFATSDEIGVYKWSDRHASLI